MTDRQKRGYDEAARGGRGVPPSDVGLPGTTPDDQGQAIDDRARRDDQTRPRGGDANSPG